MKAFLVASICSILIVYNLLSSIHFLDQGSLMWGIYFFLFAVWLTSSTISRIPRMFETTEETYRRIWGDDLYEGRFQRSSM